MNTATTTAAVTALSVLLTLSACEESGSSNSGGAELADQPKSLMGKSAGSARNLADSIRNNDAATTALADRLAGSGTIEVSGLVFEIPKGWNSVAPSIAGAAAELTGPGITVAISNKSISIDGSIEDWEDAFTDETGSAGSATINDERFNGLDATLVELSGTWAEQGPAGLPTRHDDWSMLAAIFPQGRSSVFLQLTGPSDAVDDAYDDWMGMIESVGRP